MNALVLSLDILSFKYTSSLYYLKTLIVFLILSYLCQAVTALIHKYLIYDRKLWKAFNNIKRSRIELAFPKYEQEDENNPYISKGGTGENLGSTTKHLSITIDTTVNWFKQYQVESIELWMNYG